MTEFKVGDKVLVCSNPYYVNSGEKDADYVGVLSNTIGVVIVDPNEDPDNILIRNECTDSFGLYVSKNCLTDTIGIEGLDDEAIQKVKEFADSFRKQAPPTEENKYIWLIEGEYLVLGQEPEVLGIRDADGDYRYLAEGDSYIENILSDQVTKWRPAQVS